MNLLLFELSPHLLTRPNYRQVVISSLPLDGGKIGLHQAMASGTIPLNLRSGASFAS